jgi:signal peptidase II
MKPVPANRYLVFALVTGLGLGWDLYSKWLVFATLGYELRQSDYWLTWLWGDHVFCLMTSLNGGALWGMGQGYSSVFAWLSVLAIIGVLYWLFVKGAAHSWWLTVALAFIMAGTLGNLYDRMGLHGLLNSDGTLAYKVRDFMYIECIRWPIFNFADTFLVTGAIMLLIQSFRAEPSSNPAPVTMLQPPKASPAG